MTQVVSYCKKHGMQNFYEYTVKRCCSESIHRRCCVCKYEYYLKTKEIKRSKYAKNQLIYRIKLKNETVKAYSKNSCCVLCGEKEFLILIDDDTRRIPLTGNESIKLRKLGYPSGFSVVCKNCIRKIKQQVQ